MQVCVGAVASEGYDQPDCGTCRNSQSMRSTVLETLILIVGLIFVMASRNAADLCAIGEAEGPASDCTDAGGDNIDRRAITSQPG